MRKLCTHLRLGTCEGCTPHCWVFCGDKPCIVDLCLVVVLIGLQTCFKGDTVALWAYDSHEPLVLLTVTEGSGNRQS